MQPSNQSCCTSLVNSGCESMPFRLIGIAWLLKALAALVLIPHYTTG